MKASLSPLAICSFERNLAQNAFWRERGVARHGQFCSTKTGSERWMGKVCRAMHARIGSAVRMTVQASFSQLQVLFLKEGSHESFHIFKVQLLKEVLQESFVFNTFEVQILEEVSPESFVFTSSTCSF